MNYIDHLFNNKKVFFNYMKEDYPLFKHSNLFLRDLQYAIKSYFDLKEYPVNYLQAEKLAKEFISELTKSNELVQIDNKSWKINFDIDIKSEENELEGV